MKAIIIDDEARARQVLKAMARKYVPALEIIGEADSVAEGIRRIREGRPDILFLDIEMPGEDGFALLENYVLPDLDIIFTTAYEQYAIRAMRLGAQDYLLKPIGVDDLCAAVERYEVRHAATSEAVMQAETDPEKRAQKVMLSTEEGFLMVKIEDIVQCEGAGPYTVVHLLDGRQIPVTRNLKTFDQQFGDYGFHRAHHRHLVQLAHITKLNARDNFVLMADGSRINISLRKKAGLIRRLRVL